MVHHLLYKFYISILIISSVLLFVGCQWVGQERVTEEIPVEDFIFKSEQSQYRLSPDGKKIAYLGLHDHCKNIFLLDIDDRDSSKQLTYQEAINVQQHYWINDTTILYTSFHSEDDQLRIYTVNTHTDKISRIVDPLHAKLNFIKPVREFDGAVYVTMNLRDSAVFDLYKIFLDGSSPQLVYENPGSITSWYPSEDGVVRLAMSNDSTETRLLYRENGQSLFETTSKMDFNTNFIPFGYVRNSDSTIYALSNIDRDKQALVTFDVKRGVEIAKLHEDKDVDLNYEGYAVVDQEMYFASRSRKEKKYTFFQKKLDTVYQKLSKEFEGCSIDFVDIDSNLNHFILRSYSDVRPETYFLYVAEQDSLELLSTTYPDLADKQLAHTEQVTFSARDQLEIDAFITYPGRQRTKLPLVVLVHDGPANRDYWHFQPEVQFLANRGYAVFQVNYRGTLGYGKAHRVAGYKEWGGHIQSDITDGVTWLIHEGIVDKDRMAIMGTGFGGYSALYAACFNPSLFRCAISATGYTNLYTYFREIPPHLKPYVQMYYQLIGNPETEARLFKSISPLFHADQVKQPILLFQGGKDRFTSVNDASQFVVKLKQNNVPVRYIFKEDEGRRFRKEENMVLYYQEIEQFLNTYLR